MGTTNSVTSVDLMRHGEPQGGRRYRGNRIDDPLSETGWQQMWNAIPPIPPWHHIISSPMCRCRDFAEALAESLDIDYSVMEDLKEIGFGDWEGSTPDEIRSRHGEALDRFLADPVNNTPPGAEPLEDFAHRILSGYASICHDYQGQHVLVIGHAGVLRVVTSHVLGMPLAGVYSHLKIDYAAIVRTRYYNEQHTELVMGSVK